MKFICKNKTIYPLLNRRNITVYYTPLLKWEEAGNYTWGELIVFKWGQLSSVKEMNQK